MSITRKNATVAVVILMVLAAAGIAAWYKMLRDVPQPAWIGADSRDAFLYGSVGAEKTVGVPYWIFLVLPRIFQEYLPEGGYAGLGLPWEESREMPVGLSKKTVGYVRVAGNCALCHAYSRRDEPNKSAADFASGPTPVVFAAGTGQTAAVQRLLQFFKQCAQDPRFTAGDILGEIDSWTKLSFLDRLIYRFILIPQTRARFLQQDSVIVDASLWRHSQDPHAGAAFRPRLQTLEAGLAGAEKNALIEYLRTLK